MKLINSVILLSDSLDKNAKFNLISQSTINGISVEVKLLR